MKLEHWQIEPDQIGAELGLAWTTAMPADWLGDTLEENASCILLFEDNVPLGPPHAQHDDVRLSGRGAYSHWHHTLIFSTSDGTDPRSNQRRYRVFRDTDAAVETVGRGLADGGATGLPEEASSWSPERVEHACAMATNYLPFLRPGVGAVDRRQKLLNFVDVPSMLGLEFGPLDRPVVHHTEGDIRYIDYISTAVLRETRRSPDDYDLERLAEIDFVCSDLNLKQAVGSNRFDYVIASHVIEHVPDIIGWLRAVADIVVDGGYLCLAVPDKRFTFDKYRAEATLTDMVGAYLHRNTRFTGSQIFDFFLNYAYVDAAQAWASDESEFPRQSEPQSALAQAEATLSRSTPFDPHLWVFTPRSFLSRLAELRQLGVLDWSVVDFYSTLYGEYEFIITLQKARPAQDMTDYFLGFDTSIERGRQSARESLFRTAVFGHRFDEAEFYFDSVAAHIAWVRTAGAGEDESFSELIGDSDIGLAGTLFALAIYLQATQADYELAARVAAVLDKLSAHGELFRGRQGNDVSYLVWRAKILENHCSRIRSPIGIGPAADD